MYRIPWENGRGNYNPAWASWYRVGVNILKKKGRADREIGKKPGMTRDVKADQYY